MLLFTGTRFSMGYKRSWIDFELIFLGIHIDTIFGWCAWGKSGGKSCEYHFNKFKTKITSFNIMTEIRTFYVEGLKITNSEK